jgi:hypothetical protein
MTGLILQRADLALDDYDVLEDGTIIGRVFMSPSAPEHRPWEWTANDHGGRPPTYGYEPTREEAMAAFAKSWLGGRDYREFDAEREGIDELSANLREVLVACIQRGMQLPFIVCAVSPNGSVYCIRCNGEAEPDMLAHHVEPEGFRRPVTFMVVDQIGAAIHISVEKGRLTFH